MLNKLVGWDLFKGLGANFDTIRFEITVGAGSSASPLKVTKTVGDAVRGSEQRSRLTGGENFIVTNLYSLCEPGKVSIDIMPNNNSNNKVSIVVFKARNINIEIPKILEVDVTIDIYNAEPQSNDVTLAFEGFWIPESQTPVFTDRANSIFRLFNDIDTQLLQANSLLATLIKRVDITNNLLIDPKSYTIQEYANLNPPPIELKPTEKVELKRICGTGAKEEKEDEEDE